MLLALAVAGAASAARGAESDEAAPPPPAEQPPASRAETIETANLEDPAFPTPRIADAFRIRLESRFLPGGSFDDFDVDLYRPELRLRVTAPLSERAVLQLTGRFGAAVYDFDRDGLPILGGGQPFDEFFRANLTLQGGFRLNQSRFLFREGEVWSALVGGGFNARWESGAFSDGINGGGAFALGYEIDDLIRLAAGFRIASRLDDGGVRVSPIGSFKWDITERITLRNRGRGAQLEYKFSKRFETFVTSALESDSYRLDGRAGLPDDLTFRDRTVVAGVGFEWKPSRHFRVNVESGAIAWREIRLRSQDQGTLGRERGDPGGYLSLRFELRP